MIGTLERAHAILRDRCGDRVRAACPLAPLTTLRVGGPAALFMEAESEDDLAAAAATVAATGIPSLVLGKGSNLLVSDGGFEGIVIRLGKGFRWVTRDGERLSAGGAMPLPALAGVALSHSLSGLEWGVAIPASFGGAVRMNAGAHGGEIADVLETIVVFEIGSGRSLDLPAEDAGFTYRSSCLPADGIVTRATVRLTSGAAAGIRARMDEVREWRRVHQPLAEPNCGSVFKNPAGDFAARLIEAAGLKGTTVGGAAVSTKHANFIVTTLGTRAADVVALIRAVQETVKARFDIHLEPEVRLVGRFDQVPH